MTELLNELCSLNGTSGDEGKVRSLITNRIDGKCEFYTDNLGNIIAFKKGKKRAVKKVLLDAHMDETGLIITSVTEDGFLRFAVVGGMDTAVLLCRKVVVNGSINGVIGMRPVHLAKGGDGKKLPEADSLYIDIGAENKNQALAVVSPGDRAVISGNFIQNGDKIISKALDDRVGCAILAKLLCGEAEYDFYASFSVQEEVGLRGAKTAAFAIEPDSAIILEGTTAADIAGVLQDKQVCALGKGAAVSFMDGATVYDRGYFEAAVKSRIPVQVKAAVSGGNNSGAVHLSRSGVRTAAISVPCRYIHSASSVCDIDDIRSAEKLAVYMLNGIAGGDI